MKWLDKAVLVTGGGSGIGRATCLRFGLEGARVAIVDRDIAKAKETLSLMKDHRGDSFLIGADVGAESEVQKAVGETMKQFGKIDVLVNNAGIHSQVRITELSLAEWNHVLATNLTSVFLFSKETIPHMLRAGGGAIVNVCSVHALATVSGYSAYAASKGGIAALTRAMALDVARDNIRVNAVLPGAIHTPMLEIGASAQVPREQILKEWDEAQPFGRVGQPEEIATVILFAANSENSFMSGSCLVVDGGMTSAL
jgi:glucose 1-dehydrogenase